MHVKSQDRLCCCIHSITDCTSGFQMCENKVVTTQWVVATLHECCNKSYPTMQTFLHHCYLQTSRKVLDLCLFYFVSIIRCIANTQPHNQGFLPMHAVFDVQLLCDASCAVCSKRTTCCRLKPQLHEFWYCRLHISKTQVSEGTILRV